jgi:hypothetical protein
MKSSLAYAALCVSCALSGVSAATEDTAIFAYYAQQVHSLIELHPTLDL